jgi:hypothetical protein
MDAVNILHNKDQAESWADCVCGAVQCKVVAVSKKADLLSHDSNEKLLNLQFPGVIKLKLSVVYQTLLRL